VDDETAVADVGGELVEQGEAALLEVLLDFDFARMVFERAELVGETQPVGLEFGADAREEDVHGAYAS